MNDSDAQLDEIFGCKTSVDVDSDDENELTRAKVVDRYEEENDSDENAFNSDLRKRNVQSLDQIDERYAGKKVSRKDIYDTEYHGKSEGSEDLSDSDDASSLFHSENDGETSKVDNNMKSLADSEDDDEEISDESQGDESDQEDSDEDEEVEEKNDKSQNFRCMSDTNVQEKIEQGACVQNQLKMWENLVEARIKLQKCVVVSNKMPQYDVHENFQSDKNFAKGAKEATNKLSKLLDNLLELQSALLKNFPETKNYQSKTKNSKTDKEDQCEEENDPMDEEILSNTEDEAESSKEVEDDKNEDEEEQRPSKKRKLVDYEKILDKNHKMYRDYRNSVIQKWNDRTRVVISGSNKTSSQPIMEQIKYSLSDKSKLMKRTQLKRSEYEIVGKEPVTEDKEGRRVMEYDVEVYDDDDFYHQLLRELIEYKSSGVTDSVQLSRQWIELQNMRRKMKRKIDTRATKGRRIRYNVHQKLVNYMAPVAINDNWTDIAKDELYSSLFGKIKAVESDRSKMEQRAQ